MHVLQASQLAGVLANHMSYPGLQQSDGNDYERQRLWPSFNFILTASPRIKMASSSAPNPVEMVETFNALPRNRTFPTSDHTNSFHISLRAIPLDPPSSILFILHLPSGYRHMAGPIPPSADDAPSEVKATIWAMLLLEAFNAGLGVDLPAGPGTEGVVGRPWSWNCSDAEMAGALGETLRGMGVKAPEGVGLAKDEDNRRADEQWEVFLGSFLRTMK